MFSSRTSSKTFITSHIPGNKINSPLAFLSGPFQVHRGPLKRHQRSKTDKNLFFIKLQMDKNCCSIMSPIVTSVFGCSSRVYLHLFRKQKADK